MKTELELLKLSKDVSSDYMSKGIDLNTSLKKVAQAQNLNAQEIKRVAEQANTETYLSMVGPSKDKYVEFPVADAEQVISDLSIKTATTIEDMSWADFEFKKTASVDFSFALLSDEYKDMDKDLAKPIRPDQIRLEKEVLAEKELYKEAAEVAADIDQAYNRVYAFVKNEMAQGSTTFDEVTSYIKTAGFEIANDVIDLLKLDLQKAFPIVDFTKEASSIDKEIDTSLSLYNDLKEIDDKNNILFSKYAKLGFGAKAGIAGLVGLSALGLTGASYLAGHVNGRKAAGFGNLNKGSAIAAMQEANQLR